MIIRFFANEGAAPENEDCRKTSITSDGNIRVESYYVSKLLVLFLFSGVQTALLFTVVRFWCGPPGPFLGELAVLLALSLAGVTLGLAISACAATEELAITLIPMAVIPQIIMSGVICPLAGLSKTMAMIGISTYWTKRGLDACLPENVAGAMPDLEQHSLSFAMLVLLAHSAAGVAVALAALHWQRRRTGDVYRFQTFSSGAQSGPADPVAGVPK